MSTARLTYRLVRSAPQILEAAAEAFRAAGEMGGCDLTIVFSLHPEPPPETTPGALLTRRHSESAFVLAPSWVEPAERPAWPTGPGSRWFPGVPDGDACQLRVAGVGVRFLVTGYQWKTFARADQLLDRPDYTLESANHVIETAAVACRQRLAAATAGASRAVASSAEHHVCAFWAAVVEWHSDNPLYVTADPAGGTVLLHLPVEAAVLYCRAKSAPAPPAAAGPAGVRGVPPVIAAFGKQFREAIRAERAAVAAAEKADGDELPLESPAGVSEKQGTAAAPPPPTADVYQRLAEAAANMRPALKGKQKAAVEAIVLAAGSLTLTDLHLTTKCEGSAESAWGNLMRPLNRKLKESGVRLSRQDAKVVVVAVSSEKRMKSG